MEPGWLPSGARYANHEVKLLRRDFAVGVLFPG